MKQSVAFRRFVQANQRLAAMINAVESDAPQSVLNLVMEVDDWPEHREEVIAHLRSLEATVQLALSFLTRGKR